TGQVHHANHVLKARMLGGRKNPPRGLQLVDVSHSLQPRMIDNLSLAGLARREIRAGSERDIPMNGVVTEIFVLIVAHGVIRYRAKTNGATTVPTGASRQKSGNPLASPQNDPFHLL